MDCCLMLLRRFWGWLFCCLCVGVLGVRFGLQRCCSVGLFGLVWFGCGQVGEVVLIWVGVRLGLVVS